MRLFFATLLVGALVASAQQPDAALAVYEQGKVLYDAKDFTGALAKFDEAIALEPTKARWQYNRGLALKKLKRDDDARAAFLESQRLDPEYKRDEIRQKLGELAPPSSGTSTSPPDAQPVEWTTDTTIGLVFCLVLGLVPVAIIAVFVRAVMRRRQAGAGVPPPQQRAAQVDRSAARAALLQVGPRLARLEHAISLGEDAEARAHLDRANSNFQQLRRFVQRPDLGTPQEVDGTRARLESAVAAAETRLRARHGAAFDTALGPQAGCFFCARPLPTAEARQALTLKVRGQPTEVSACLPCARRATGNDAPKVTTVGGAHWATVRGIDPYVFAYSEQVDAREVPLGSLSRDGADVAHLAMLAGAAVGGAALGAAVMRALDVDALAEAEAASAAAEAAARSASSRRSETSWKDHS